jgi:signal transduction histidine kinase
MKDMSIQKALVGSMLGICILATVLIGSVGVLGISSSVRKEAQKRVNHDLNIIVSHYHQRVRSLAGLVQQSGNSLEIDSADLQQRLQTLQDELDLTILNVCNVNGKPIAGSYTEGKIAVPVQSDPVLREALEGELAWGTVLLQPDRLVLEGGQALHNAMAVSGKGNMERPSTRSALFSWAAAPLRDPSGRVKGLIYGGRALNYNFELVDELRDLVFGKQLYEGKPLGTVTVFLKGVRVTTNVLDRQGERAIGTRVSRAVRQHVLEDGEVWQDRAWVVDSWYLSAYEPLRNPNGKILGMLYVGMLEAPYVERRNDMIWWVIGMLVLIGLVAVILGVYLVRRITAPVKQLSEAAVSMAKGDEHEHVSTAHSYYELNELARSFNEMQDAIAQRDRELREQNAKLTDTNEQLARANNNYMETLGFVTHELKSPLAAMYSMLDVIMKGYVGGELPEKTKEYLGRVRRSCQEMQDMVKNYLDLSRAERGELSANIKRFDFYKEVVDPCVQQNLAMFEARGIELEVQCPEELEVEADPELMRIALTNYLSNAAKYSKDNGRARLIVQTEDGRLKVSMWNEGSGFTEEEKQDLFRKFSRLRNEASQGRRGSGLGLFLCRQIAELHDGQVWADSEPGQWAQFNLSFPLKS